MALECFLRHMLVENKLADDLQRDEVPYLRELCKLSATSKPVSAVLQPLLKQRMSFFSGDRAVKERHKKRLVGWLREGDIVNLGVRDPKPWDRANAEFFKNARVIATGARVIYISSGDRCCITVWRSRIWSLEILNV
jgi:hypothetical protein